MKKLHSDNLFTPTGPEESAAGHIIQVAFESAVDNVFDYLVPEELLAVQPGQRVEAPFGRANKLTIGFCVDLGPSASIAPAKRKFKLKTIHKTVDDRPLLDEKLLSLAKWISEYYVCPLGQALSAIVPSAVKKGAGIKKETLIYLSADFEKSAEQLKGKKQKQIVNALKQQQAFGSDSAVSQNRLTQQIGCTKGPITKLVDKQIVKITRKESFSALPVIPQSLSKKTGKDITLNADQQNALDVINGKIDSGSFSVTLLHGVTDSGKTELYIRAVQRTIEDGKTAIVLLPEIALTTQTVQRFAGRFEKLAVMHSALTAAQRNVQWQNIKTGKSNLVIGARSAVFAPLSNLGLIVVDEEHEPSYKQDTVPRYHARDVAIKRTQLADAHCILGSATPSLETLHNCRAKSFFSLVSLPKRVMDLPSPQMKLVDMRTQPYTSDGINLISEPLAEHLQSVLAKNEQAILLLNRRGYSNFIFCPACRYTLHCRNCDVTLTFHKSKLPKAAQASSLLTKHIDYGYAVCHYCLAQTLVPQKCPLCQKGLAMIGLGSQRLEEELKRKFSQARIARVDSDSMSGRDYYKLLSDFGLGRIDVLAGTQMLAKGLHFPNVTLVGIISADTSLYLPDFRTNERTFQLICQVAGRAGRSEKKGTVYVQTFLPDQPAISFALDRDFAGFVTEELKHRKRCNLPPFWRMAAILLRDTKYDKLEKASQNLREILENIIAANNLKALIRGPIPAVISRMQRYHRIQIIIQAPQPQIIQKLFAELRRSGPVKPAVKIAIDIDPVNLL